MAHERAIAAAKRAFEGRCVFTGLTGVDGMHLYPAGRYPEYADEPLNIFPGVRYVHSVRGRACFDLRADGSERPVWERIWMLRNLTHDDLRAIVISRVEKLLSKIGALTPETGDKEYGRPIDAEILRCGQSDWWQSPLAAIRDYADANVFADFGRAADTGDDKSLVVAPLG
jgi:hypothetical protein